MKNTFLLLVIGFFLWSLHTSCVSSKKYNALEEKYNKADINARSKENRLDLLESENNRLKNELFLVRQEKAKLEEEVSLRRNMSSQEVAALHEENQRLQRDYNLLRQNSSLEASAQRQRIQNQEQQLAQVNPNQNGGYPYNGNNSPNQITINNNGYPNYTAANPSSGTAVNKSQVGANLGVQDGTNYSGIDYANPAAEAQLFNLQNQLTSVLQGFSSGEVSLVKKEGRLYVQISDAVLYTGSQYALSQRGQMILKNVTSVIGSYNNLSVGIESEPSQSAKNPTGYLKSKSVAQLLSAEGIAYTFHKKNFLPLAFDTSGTRARTPQTSIILSPR